MNIPFVLLLPQSICEIGSDPPLVAEGTLYLSIVKGLFVHINLSLKELMQLWVSHSGSEPFNYIKAIRIMILIPIPPVHNYT